MKWLEKKQTIKKYNYQVLHISYVDVYSVFDYCQKGDKWVENINQVFIIKTRNIYLLRGQL